MPLEPYPPNFDVTKQAHVSPALSADIIRYKVCADPVGTTGYQKAWSEWRKDL